MARQPKESFAERVDSFMQAEAEAYFGFLDE